MPPDGDLSSYQCHLRTWPLVDEPELFGFHANAHITFNRHDARRIIEAVLLVQPRMDMAAEEGSNTSSSSSAESERRERPQALGASVTSRNSSRQRSGSSSNLAVPEAQTSSSSIDTGQQQAAAMQLLVEELLDMLPAALRITEASILRNPFSPLAGGQVNPLGVILQQEMDR